ncbi:tape measure protein [Bariatricus sp. HCP28S3_D3]|uniref:tape measure protein n=1 Tax=Bariatricus sp. HCP28S3_D3 TaxID=3438901 RepID=UPI003F8C9AF8
MGDFSVRAVLSAVDKNFASTMKSALGYTNNLKDTLTSGIGFGAMMAIGQSAVQTVMGEMSSLSKETIETSDSMYKLQAAMRFSGYEEKEIQRIAGATGTLKTYADKTVFSLQDVMSTFGALSANGIKDADKLTEAVGNAVAVFGGGAQEYSSVALAFSQAMASGALHAQDWNQILNASPQLAGGLRKELIKLNPKIGKDFKKAMEDGALTADLLAEAMNNIGMTEMAKEAATSVTTFEGAMGNLEATVVSGMMNLYDSFAKSSVIDAINGMNEKIGSGFDWLAVRVPAAIDKISPYWAVFKTDFIEVKNAFGYAVSAIVGHVGELTDSFGSAESVSSFSDVLGVATDALKSFAGFCEEHSEIIAKVLTTLPKLYVAYKGFKIVKAVAPFVGMFTGAIGGLAKLGISKLVPGLFGVSKGQDAVGKSSGRSSNKMLASAKSFMMLGVGVLTISTGFYLLAQSAVAVANAGPVAIGVLIGLVGVVSALSVGMLKMLSSMSGGTKKLSAMSTAMMAVGASILLISAGFALLSYSAIQLASAGPAAIATMVGMVAAVGALMYVAKSVAPALTAGAVGFVAFGAAVLVAGVGMALMTSAAINLANAGPLAIGVMVGMVAAVALLAAGAALLGPVLTAGAVGFVAFGAAILMVGAGAVLASAALYVVAAVLPTVTEYGLQGAVAIVALGAGMTVFAAGAALAGIGCVALGAGLVVATVGLLAFSAGIVVTSAGMLVLYASLKLVNSSMKSISKNAKTAQKSLSSMKSSMSIVNEGLDAIGNKAKSSMNSMISAFDGASSKAKGSGGKVGSAFNSGLGTGMTAAIGTAKSSTNTIISVFNSTSSRSYSCGVYIGQGLANGMRSQLGAVRSVATQLASAAEAAIRAKAKINSPSKVAEDLGGYWGGGYVGGILSKVKEAWRASEKMVSVPSKVMKRQKLAVAGGYGNMELSDDYTYYQEAKYTIIVPVELEGREIAKASATYTQDELEKKDKLKNMLKGIKDV